MINIVLCEDNLILAEEIKKNVIKSLIAQDRKYTFRSFLGYCDSLNNIINDKNIKIYILDIELRNSISGLEISSKIRESGDWNSVIIFLTSHNEYIATAVSKKIQIFDYISKVDDFISKLCQTINESYLTFGNRQEIKICYDSKIEYINPKDLLFVEKEVGSNYLLIHLLNHENIRLEKPIIEIYNMFKGYLVYSHRSCLINMQNVSVYDFYAGQIVFIDGSKTWMLSRKYRHLIKEMIRG